MNENKHLIETGISNHVLHQIHRSRIAQISGNKSNEWTFVFSWNNGSLKLLNVKWVMTHFVAVDEVDRKVVHHYDCARIQIKSVPKLIT